MKHGGHNKRRPTRPSRLWHRWLGFILLLPLLFSALTGLLLNHAGQLGWHDKQARADWILDRYGMELEGDPVSFSADGHLISAWAGQLFLNGSTLDAPGDLLGAVRLPSGIAVVMPRAIRLYDTNGVLIEALDEASLPDGAITRAGWDPQRRLLVRIGESEVWRFSPDLLDLEPGDPAAAPATWSEPVPTPEPLRQAMQSSYRGQGMPWSRVLLDLHSGRFFGTAGRWFMDILVVLVVLLAGTGLVVGIRALAGNGHRHGSG